MQYSKNMSHLSFLSVPISGFLPLFKAAKWTRIILIFSAFEYQYYHLYHLYPLRFEQITYTSCGFTCSLEQPGLGGLSSKMTKTTWLHLCCCEQVAYVNFRSLFIMKTWIIYGKNGLVRHINGLSPEIKYIIKSISTWFFTGAPMSTNCYHRVRTLWRISFSPLKTACTVEFSNLWFSCVEDMV